RDINIGRRQQHHRMFRVSPAAGQASSHEMFAIELVLKSLTHWRVVKLGEDIAIVLGPSHARTKSGLYLDLFRPGKGLQCCRQRAGSAGGELATGWEFSPPPPPPPSPRGRGP